MGVEKEKLKSETDQLTTPKQNKDRLIGYIKGISLTLVLALIANLITQIPFFSIMGIMIISIILGVVWNVLLGTRDNSKVGITFSSKILLRAGIILMGVRLNLGQIIEAGPAILLIDITVIIFTLIIMFGLGKAFKVDRHLNTLIAVGTAVCGAAAIVAVASVIKSKKEYTALAVACVAILGTFGALGYIFLYPFLDIDSYSYGVLVGATLHELAHVIAAAVPGGDISSDTALLVKLGRVALLIPVVIVIGYLFKTKEEKKETSFIKRLPVPWFIFGFLGMSMLNTFVTLPDMLINLFILLSVYLLSMAMAGLGLSINFSDFKKVGWRPVVVGILGFVALVGLGPVLLMLL